MKLVALLLAFCLSLNVMAASGTIQELERNIDDYQYALTVEWDQKNEKFYNDQTQLFFKKMEALINAGLSQKDIQFFAEKRLKDPKAVEALQLKLKLATKNASAQDLVGIVKESTKDMYATGASWNGYSNSTIILTALVVTLLAYGAWWNSQHECVDYQTDYVCRSYTDCNGYGSCYSRNDCGFEKNCVRYERK